MGEQGLCQLYTSPIQFPTIAESAGEHTSVPERNYSISFYFLPNVKREGKRATLVVVASVFDNADFHRIIAR